MKTSLFFQTIHCSITVLSFLYILGITYCKELGKNKKKHNKQKLGSQKDEIVTIDCEKFDFGGDSKSETRLGHVDSKTMRKENKFKTMNVILFLHQHTCSSVFSCVTKPKKTFCHQSLSQGLK